MSHSTAATTAPQSPTAISPARARARSDRAPRRPIITSTPSTGQRTDDAAILPKRPGAEGDDGREHCDKGERHDRKDRGGVVISKAEASNMMKLRCSGSS